VDGVPVAELALSEAMPLGVAVGSDIGVVAGACYPLIYQIYIRLIRPEKSLCKNTRVGRCPYVLRPGAFD
jgi:hypothetical protein